MVQDSDLRHLPGSVLSRVGRHARYLDGLREVGRRQAVAAKCHHRVVDRMCRIRGTDSLESVIVAAIKSSIPSRRFDVVIVGAGGSGMRASLQLAEAGLNVAVLS